MANVNLANFIKDLAEKAGMNINDEAIIADVFSNVEFQKFLIPEQITNGINRSLVSLADAKNNHPAIKSHYFGEFMGNLDRGLESGYEEAGFDQDTINELNKEKSSTRRVALAFAKAKELREKESATNKKPSEQIVSLNQTITDLNEKLRIEKEGRKTDNDTSTGKIQNLEQGYILTGKVGGIKTIYDELPSEVRFLSVKNLLDKELQDSNATLILENGSLKLQKKDGSNYFDENNRQLNVDDFINKTLAKHKVLKQSAPNSELSGGNLAATNGQPTVVNGNGKSKINIGSLMEESLKGLEAEPTKMI